MTTETRQYQFNFEPPLTIPAKSTAEISMDWNTGRVRVVIFDTASGFVVENRPDCQVVEQTIVAMPGSIERHKLPWKVRLLRWLARG